MALNDNKPNGKKTVRTRKQNARNLALFLGLLAFVALVYCVTIVKIKQGYGP